MSLKSCLKASFVCALFSMSYPLFSDAAKVAAPAKVVVAPSARALSEIMLSKEQFGQMKDAIAQNAFGMASQYFKGDEPAQKKQFDGLKADVEKQFTYDYFMRLNSESMSKMMTEPELKQVLAFYQTATGKKWNLNTPNIINETMMKVRGDMESMIPAFIEKHKLPEPKTPAPAKAPAKAPAAATKK